MKLSMIFAQLQSAELNNLSCVDPVTKKIKPEKYADVVSVISSGLTDLHTRFVMKLGYVTFPLIADQEVYRLSTIEPSTKFDLLRIHSVSTGCGRELGMNDHTERFSVFTSDNFTLHVPSFLRVQEGVTELKVAYRRGHKPLKVCCDFDDADEIGYIDVDLDYAYLYALCLYVASRLHGPVGLQDSTHSINAYVGLYNAECARLEEANLSLDYIAVNTKPRINGWP